MGDPRPKGGEDEVGGLTEDLNKVVMEAGGRPSKEARVSFPERTRLAWQVVKPYWNKTTWWTMLAVAIMMIGLDLNARFGGFLSRSIEWVRANVMAEYPSIAFITGMVACYYLVLGGRGKVGGGE